MFRVVAMTNRFNFQMVNYICTLIESIGYTWPSNNCTVPFQKGVQTIWILWLPHGDHLHSFGKAYETSWP